MLIDGGLEGRPYHSISRVFGVPNAQYFHVEIAESSNIFDGLADELDIRVLVATFWMDKKEELYLWVIIIVSGMRPYNIRHNPQNARNQKTPNYFVR